MPHHVRPLHHTAHHGIHLGFVQEVLALVQQQALEGRIQRWYLEDLLCHFEVETPNCGLLHLVRFGGLEAQEAHIRQLILLVVEDVRDDGQVAQQVRAVVGLELLDHGGRTQFVRDGLQRHQLGEGLGEVSERAEGDVPDLRVRIAQQRYEEVEYLGVHQQHQLAHLGALRQRQQVVEGDLEGRLTALLM